MEPDHLGSHPISATSQLCHLGRVNSLLWASYLFLLYHHIHHEY